MTDLQTAVEALENLMMINYNRDNYSDYSKLLDKALAALRQIPESVSKEAIATALCGASGSVGGDWRDKKMVRIEGSKDRIVDAIYALQLTAPISYRTDTTAPVGYSREQMVTAMQWADVTDHYIKEDRDEYLSDPTPASKVQIFTVDDIEDLIQSFGKPDDEGRGWAVFEKDFDKLAQAIHAFLTKSRGGV